MTEHKTIDSIGHFKITLISCIAIANDISVDSPCLPTRPRRLVDIALCSIFAAHTSLFLKVEKVLTVKKSAQVKEHDETAQSKDFKNTLADIWSEVLEVKHVDDHSNFFSLGGDSLKATVVISKLKMKYNVNLPMKIIFEKPILKDLSEEVGNIYNNN